MGVKNKDGCQEAEEAKDPEHDVHGHERQILHGPFLTLLLNKWHWFLWHVTLDEGYAFTGLMIIQLNG